MPQVVTVSRHPISIPDDSFEQDIFIGLWRKAQDLAVHHIVSTEKNWKRNINYVIDDSTIYFFYKLRRQNATTKERIYKNQ